MCHNNNSFKLAHINRVNQTLLAFFIESTCWFIKNQYVRIFIQCTSNSYLLLLSTGKIDSTICHHCIQALLKLCNIFIQICSDQNVFYIICINNIVLKYVICNSSIHQVSILINVCNVLPNIFLCQSFHITTKKGHFTFIFCNRT